ncbi:MULTISPECIES: glycosyltransferase family A protein [unclassified Bradyrhizobium]|uniref:glycosyltransferase family 2 protein n=1 Tax=unclassified Bradyrhizobium TaxID=2631580 RepID=UPI001FFA82A6|nr:MULTISPECIES: glycosyltransferase family A protein [unclassified Bradyrhizobium]MCK1328784.1 glycosyltransferase family 2 protein [Bradyrhizobium sp. CW9]MCK1693440.1 glycosyltransferase family 2 protein [Bradyrhizobium sp. 144]
MANPLVSVVVTTFNHEQYIEDALASVFRQSFTDFEVIVVDDGSTDDTPERLAAFGDQITLIRQPNAGVAGSRNTGVSHARGQFVAFLDGDDIWHEEKLGVQVAAALAHPEAGLIAVDGVQFEGDSILSNSLFRDIGPIGEWRDGIVTGNCYARLLHSQIICTISQVMVQAAVLRAIGPSDSGFLRASDYDLYIRISRSHSFALVRRSLVSWRYLPTSASGPNDLRSIKYLPEDIAILKKNSRDADKNSRKLIRKSVGQKRRKMARRLYDYGRDGHRRFATSTLVGFLRSNPDSLWTILYLVGLWSPRFLTRYVGGGLRAIRDAFNGTFDPSGARKRS